MEKIMLSTNGPANRDKVLPPVAQKQPFVEPKLTWIEPKLAAHGALTATAQGGFFGSFSP